MKNSEIVRTFIVTLKRGPFMLPEFYYVPGRDEMDAKARAISIAKSREDQIVEIRPD